MNYLMNREISKKVLSVVGILILAAGGLAGCGASPKGEELAVAAKAFAANSDAGAPAADYGDAPDDSTNGAQFPTKYASNGAHHLNTKLSALGDFKEDGSLSVSAEEGATDPADPDGVANLDGEKGSDSDLYDDGVDPDFAVEEGTAALPITVSVAAGAPDIPRYINILHDKNGNMKWEAAPEWVAQNFEVHVAPGSSASFDVPVDLSGAELSGVWYRVTLSEKTVSDWEGTGEFAEGETEDYFLADFFPPDIPDDGDTPDDDDDGGDDTEDGGNGGNGGDDSEGGDGSDNSGVVQASVFHYYVTICACNGTKTLGFDSMTNVKNGSSNNEGVAGVSLENNPGLVHITPNGPGAALIILEADPVTFPWDEVKYYTIYIHVTVTPCPEGGDVQVK